MTHSYYSDLEQAHAKAITIPTGPLKVTIRACIFNDPIKAHYFQKTFWSDRFITLLKYAIIDTFGHEDYKDEPEHYKGNVEAFTSFCVIKDRVYTHTYTAGMFEQDLQTAQCQKFSKRAITVIKLVPAEVITFNEPLNRN
jgi:hypothetical protein